MAIITGTIRHLSAWGGFYHNNLNSSKVVVWMTGLPFKLYCLDQILGMTTAAIRVLGFCYGLIPQSG